VLLHASELKTSSLFPLGSLVNRTRTKGAVGQEGGSLTSDRVREEDPAYSP
jgi:hypothetical protein